MLARCGHRGRGGHKRYAGRGIKVCPRWQNDFIAFLKDMGPRPGPGYSLERDDNDGDYEPANCRWASRIEQARNTSAIRKIEYSGKIWSLTGLAEAHGMRPETLSGRIDRGMTIEQAVTEPVRRVIRHGPDDRPKQDRSHWPMRRILGTSQR